MRRTRHGLFAALAVLAGHAAGAQESRSSTGAFPERLAVVMVWDGMRPDLVSPELTPNLHALALRGVVAAAHHAVVPTVTRVNAATLASGCPPGRTGILGNSISAPELRPDRIIDTSDRAQLCEYEQALGGRLVTCVTLADFLAEQGLRFAVASSGSAGSAFLLDPHRRGVTLHYQFTEPATVLAAVTRACGAAPAADAEPARLSACAVTRWLDYLLPVVRPHVSFLWLTDVDKVQHVQGVGAKGSLQAIRSVDAELGRVVRGLEQRGLLERATIWVVSDHGFSSHVGAPDVAALLVRAGLKQRPLSPDVVVADGALHVREGGAERVGAVAQALLGEAWLGALFAAPAAGDVGPRGSLPGTFSTQWLGWQHARAGDLLLCGEWRDEPGPFGIRGIAVGPGPAGHGSASPFDVRATCVAAGPGIRRGVHSPVPSAHTDVAPTLCRVLGLRPPASMDGRVLDEWFADGPHPWAVAVETRRDLDSSGAFVLQTSTVVRSDGRRWRYVDSAGRVERAPR